MEQKPATTTATTPVTGDAGGIAAPTTDKATDVTDDQVADAAERPRWYVLRDLRRPNAKIHGYEQLQNEGFEVFTPMQWIIVEKRGKKSRVKKPVLADLLFVKSLHQPLADMLRLTPTLQFRYVRGGYCKPMVVGDAEMENFIKAVSISDTPVYYLPEEISDLSVGKRVRIVSGPATGLEGRILKVRGARKKRIIVELPALMATSVEVNSQFIEFID